MSLFTRKICRDIERYLTAYVQQEMDPESSRIVDEHLPTCADCHSLVSVERSLHDIDKTSYIAPAGLSDIIMAQWESREQAYTSPIQVYRQRLARSMGSIRQAVIIATGCLQDACAKIELQTQASFQIMMISARGAVNRLGGLRNRF